MQGLPVHQIAPQFSGWAMGSEGIITVNALLSGMTQDGVENECQQELGIITWAEPIQAIFRDVNGTNELRTSAVASQTT